MEINVRREVDADGAASDVAGFLTMETIRYAREQSRIGTGCYRLLDLPRSSRVERRLTR